MRIDEYQNAYLDSGKSLDLNVNISGLSIDGHGNLASGNDDANYSTDDLTAEERREVAEFMVAQWRAWGGLP